MARKDIEGAKQAIENGALESTDRAEPGPTYDQVCTRAYEIYLSRSRNRGSGDAWSDWCTAESELNSRGEGQDIADGSAEVVSVGES